MPKTDLEKYRDGGFARVEGWGVDGELIELFSIINEFQTTNRITGSLCEIGVHHGRTLTLLALLKGQGEKVVGVDLFDGSQDQNLDASGSGSRVAVLRNLAEHAPGVDVQLVCANSFDLSRDQHGLLQGARLFHIDGGHFLEVVLNDIALAQEALAVGGVVVIDDYWHSGFPEVQEAVHRYFLTSSRLKAVPFMTGKNKVYLAHTSHCHRLLEFMSSRLPSNRRKPVRVLGYGAICCDPH